MSKLAMVVLLAGLTAFCLFSLMNGSNGVNELSSMSDTLWWERVTAPEGDVLTFANKEWYARVLHLSKGASYPVDCDYDGDPDVLIVRDGDALVMIVDDNDTMASSNPFGDEIDDCWVVDRDGDALVDRMVDYVDNDGDGRSDEMEIRYYEKGRLRWAWFWEDLDGDGLMWDVQDYEYGRPKDTDMSGANLFYANKYDEERAAWLPFGECPFAFYDPDDDGFSEIAIRFVFAPTWSNQGSDLDYGNNVEHRSAKTDDQLRDLALVSVRHSFSLRNDNTTQEPYTYDIGVTLTGSLPCKNTSFDYYNAKRRAPKTTVRIPWATALSIAENYPALATGFSFDELGVNDRWEGIFWIWERRIIYNTGGTTIKYNIRREYDVDASSQRQLYYSAVDKRIHLLGAEEGWIETGNLFGEDSGKLGEHRFFDTDGDGYFDRWEIDLDNDAIPERTSTILEPQITVLDWDYTTLSAFYQKVLPLAIEENLSMIDAMRRVGGREGPYREAIASLEEKIAGEGELPAKKYLLDILREFYYQHIIENLRTAERALRVPPYTARSKYDIDKLAASIRSWDFARGVTEFEVAYARGDYSAAVSILEILGSWEPSDDEY